MNEKPRIGYCWCCGNKLQGDHHIEKPVPKWSGDDIPRILHKTCAKSYDDEVQFGYNVQVDVDSIDWDGSAKNQVFEDENEFGSYGNVFV